MDRQTKVTLWFDLTLRVKGHAKCHIISDIGQMHKLTSAFLLVSLPLLLYLYQSVYLLGLKVTQHGTARFSSSYKTANSRLVLSFSGSFFLLSFFLSSGNTLTAYTSARNWWIWTKLKTNDRWLCQIVSYKFELDMTFDLWQRSKTWFNCQKYLLLEN